MNNDPHIPSTPRIVTSAVTVQKVNNVLKLLSIQDYFSALIGGEMGAVQLGLAPLVRVSHCRRPAPFLSAPPAAFRACHLLYS